MTSGPQSIAQVTLRAALQFTRSAPVTSGRTLVRSVEPRTRFVGSGLSHDGGLGQSRITATTPHEPCGTGNNKSGSSSRISDQSDDRKRWQSDWHFFAPAKISGQAPCVGAD